MTGRPAAGLAYRLAIFDLDGTLADSFGWFLGALDGVADEFGVRRIAPEEVAALRGFEPARLLRHLGVPRWKLPMIAARMRGLMAAEIDRIRLFDGVDTMLRDLSEAGVALALVTSNSEANARRILGPRNAALFSHLGCDAAMFGKRRKLRAALRHCGVPREAAICIGDELRDLDAAAAEGIAFGAACWGYATPEALRARAPTMLFAVPAEVAPALLGAGA